MSGKNEIILFENQGIKLEVNLKDETVWLNRQQLSELFNRDVKTIGKHINNALQEELKDIPTVAKFATVQKEGERDVTRDVEYYNLDMIISVGYRVKSQNGILFRKWATKILKDYMLKGYAVNQKRLEYLEKTIKLIDIANRIDERLEGNDAKETDRPCGKPQEEHGCGKSRMRHKPSAFLLSIIFFFRSHTFVSQNTGRMRLFLHLLCHSLFARQKQKR